MSSMPRFQSTRTARFVLLTLLLCVSGPALGRYILEPKVRASAIPVGRPAAFKDYLLIGPAGAIIPLLGPGQISGYAKVHYAPKETRDKTASLRLSGVPGLPPSLDMRFTAPTRGEYADGREGMPSGSERITLSIPTGIHELKIDGGAADGSEFFLLLYYDGPEQPVTTLAIESGFEAPKPSKPWYDDFLGFNVRGYADLGFTYNTNPFNYSEQFLDLYHAGKEPVRFRFVDRADDLVISPSLELRGRRKFFPLGASEIRLSWAREQNWYNEKLANQEFRATLRQPAGRGRSLEVYYSYSPSKYLRELNDRPPFVSGNISVVSEEFRLTRNKVVGTLRQSLHKRLNSTFRLTKKLYYYNRPHIENDIDALEYQAALSWTLSGTLRLDADYSYADAKALGIDVEGQELETSPASDGTYKGNTFNAELRLKTFLPAFAKYLYLRGQYGVDYYSAKGTVKIEDDTYHVGRQDNYYTYRIKFSGDLPWYEGVGIDYGIRYDERSTDSPWWGDIKEDKNYISKTIWFGMSYRLF